MSAISDAFRNKTVRMFAIATALGLLSALLAVNYLKSREAALRQAYLDQQQNIIPVVVASADLQRGDIISSDNMSIRQIPADFVMGNVITPDDFSLAEGRNLLEPIYAGKPVPWAFVAGEGHRDFSDSINQGRRAITVQVDEVNSVSGLIRPGNRIDVYASIDSALVDEEGGDAVFPVLENVLVLATGQQSNGQLSAEGSEYTTLTLDVSPREAALLSTAQETGRIIALLRNPLDKGVSNFKFVQSSDLYRLSTAAAEDIIVDSNGNTVGRVVTKLVDGKPVEVVVDENGNEVGRMVNGEMVSEVVRDKDGNIIGRVVNGKVIDKDGNEVGKVVDGQVVDMNGNKLAGAVVDTMTVKRGKLPSQAALFIEFIAGGKSKDGVAEVQKLKVE